MTKNNIILIVASILFGIVGTLIVLGAIDNIEKEISVTIVVDESIVDANPEWMNDTRKSVEHSEELITGQKVRFTVVNQTIWQPVLIQNESSKFEFIRKLDKLEEKLHSEEGEIVLVFTKGLPKNVYEMHGVMSGKSANYLLIKHCDYLDDYRNDYEREENFKRFMSESVNPELHAIAIYAVNR